jgi:hypothetical protein
LSPSIGLIDANVTSIPALLSISMTATVSISSHPSPTGTRTDLFYININNSKSSKIEEFILFINYNYIYQNFSLINF